MGNGYPIVAPDDLSGLRDQLQKIADRITELERPTGTQDASLLATYRANKISPAVGKASSSSYTLTTSYATIASFSIAVPSGFTRALVNAQGSATSLSNAPLGGEIGFTRILINGSAGAEGTAVYPVSSTYPSIPAFGAEVLSGLSGGSILIEIQARLRTGPGVAPAGLPAAGTVTASALFLS